MADSHSLGSLPGLSGSGWRRSVPVASEKIRVKRRHNSLGLMVDISLVFILFALI